MTDLAAAITRSTLRRRRRRPLLRPLLVVAALVVLASAAVGGRALLHRGEAMPGVEVLGADLGGLTRAEAGARIRTATAARLAEPVTLAVGAREVRMQPSLLFTLDREPTAAAALAAGRDSWTARARSLLSPLTPATRVAPVLVERPRARERLDALLRRFGTPPVSARVTLNGLTPVVHESRPGVEADLDRVLAAVAQRVAAGSGAVPVTFREAAAPVSDEAAQAAAGETRLVLSAPVALTFSGQAVGQIEPERLARFVRFRAHEGRLLVLFDEERLGAALAPAVAPWQRRAVNARFEVDGARARVVPAQPGAALDAAAAAIDVATAAHSRGARTAALRLHAVPADLTTGEAQALGIRERISTFTTEMGPSSSNRIHNVHLMADYIDGTVIRPGETFSFNGSVGPRTAERGFLEGQMIVGSLLLPSIGGGVCQTATTLFNNAFELGLPIVERHNHSFYISHYPMGRDATVSWGGPDFKFRNDMEHALLIKSSYTDSTLTFSFYGTDEGRRVTASTGPQTKWTNPKLTFALDPAAPPGSVRYERGSHQNGFDVTVSRTVEKDGKTIRNDSFTSHYIPVGDTAVYGPGRAIPGPYFVIPTT